MPQRDGPPAGYSSARGEVTASEPGRVCDGKDFVGSVAFGCITGPSRAGKTEIPVKSDRANVVELFRALLTEAAVQARIWA